MTNGFQNTFLKDVEINRSYVNLLIDKGILSRASKWYKNVPMELLKVPVGIQAIKLWDELRKQGVDILPAVNYFWSNPNEGSELFRIPLARPTQDFVIAVPIIESTITSLLSK